MVQVYRHLFSFSSSSRTNSRGIASNTVNATSVTSLLFSFHQGSMVAAAGDDEEDVAWKEKGAVQRSGV